MQSEEDHLGRLAGHMLELELEAVPHHAQIGQVLLLRLHELPDRELPLALLGECGNERAGPGGGADGVVDLLTLWGGGVDAGGPFNGDGPPGRRATGRVEPLPWAFLGLALPGGGNIGGSPHGHRGG